MKNWRFIKPDFPKLLKKQLKKSGFRNTFSEAFSCHTCLEKRVLPRNTYCSVFYLINTIQTPRQKVCDFWANVDQTKGNKSDE